jgi:hypothetical protein
MTVLLRTSRLQRFISQSILSWSIPID